jgi:hypothetical protein
VYKKWRLARAGADCRHVHRTSEKATSDDGVGAAGTLRLHEHLNVVGIVLSIGVEGHHLPRPAPDSKLDAGNQRRALSEVHCLPQHDRSSRSRSFDRPIRRSIVDYDDTRKVARQLSYRTRDLRLFVEGWNDNPKASVSASVISRHSAPFDRVFAR